jgi:hypothetical protein
VIVTERNGGFHHFVAYALQYQTRGDVETLELHLHLRRPVRLLLNPQDDADRVRLFPPWQRHPMIADCHRPHMYNRIALDADYFAMLEIVT